jgi:hypothetical protein
MSGKFDLRNIVCKILKRIIVSIFYAIKKKERRENKNNP